MSDSLYAFESSAAFHIIFAFFFLIMAIILTISLITLYRSVYGNINKGIAKLNTVRYLSTFCIVIQCITFIGYYLHNAFLHEFLWNVWVPAWILAFALLSYNISNIYLETLNVAVKKKKKRKTKKKAAVVWSKDEDEMRKIEEQQAMSDGEMDYFSEDGESTETNTESTQSSTNESNTSSNRFLSTEKVKPIFWKSVWFLWSAAALSQWIASLLGWVFDLLFAQALGYMLWKLISFIMLLLCVHVLRVVKQRIECSLSNTHAYGSRRMSKSLSEGMKRIRNLMICEMVLVVVFAISIIYEIYVMISFADGSLVTNVFAESTLMSMAAYFPVWTAIHVVLCVYSWISKRSLHYDRKRNTGQQIKR